MEERWSFRTRGTELLFSYDSELKKPMSLTDQMQKAKSYQQLSLSRNMTVMKMIVMGPARTVWEFTVLSPHVEPVKHL